MPSDTYTVISIEYRKGYSSPELVFLNVYGAPESIPRNEYRQPM